MCGARGQVSRVNELMRFDFSLLWEVKWLHLMVIMTGTGIIHSPKPSQSIYVACKIIHLLSCWWPGEASILHSETPSLCPTPITIIPFCDNNNLWMTTSEIKRFRVWILSQRSFVIRPIIRQALLLFNLALSLVVPPNSQSTWRRVIFAKYW